MEKSKTRIFKNFNLGSGEKQYLSISYSQLTTFLNCPLRWKMYYLLGKGESSDTESTQLGTQVHSFIEEFCAKKQQGHEWSVAEATNLMEDKLDERTITFKPEDEDEDIVWQHLSVAKSMVEENKGLGQLLKHCDVLAQELEFKLKFNLPFAVTYKGEEYKEVIINGFIDLLLKDKDTGGLIVVDHKTSKKKFEKEKLYHDYQFPVYELVVLNLYGRLPEKCYYNFTRFNELQEVHPLVIDEKDAVVVDYYTRGKNKGKPKNKIKTVKEIENELTEIFRQMYTVGEYDANPTALCSWCTFGIYGDNACKKQKYPYYKRSDVPLPKRNVKKVKSL